MAELNSIYSLLDLAATDDIAATVLEEISAHASDCIKQQYDDNIRWIREEGKHKTVVGSQARILYSDQRGRVGIALAVNRAVADGRVSAPVVISRDHHDVSGTDSPFRETSNVGEVMNGGFGLLLDGSEEAAKRAGLMLDWDVSNVSRWLVAAGLEAPTPSRPSSAPWRRTGSCASPCRSPCRMNTCCTVG
ncbi:urocanate hydratase-like [Embiotoca jacksoni]|uniref:urocanate hydratase-like n=1 Tax=Embiotoca jacksoni TaxID=100190 RepID=UPI003703E466